MNTLPGRYLLALLACLAILTGTVALASSVPASEGSAEALGGSLPQRVFVLPVDGAIDKSMLYVFRRAFREAASIKPSAVILELNTPGGALTETREIIDWIRSLQRQGCPVYAYVNPDALSAGAMISLATKGIFMSSGATIGSAMPIAMSITGGLQELPADVNEKMLSAVRAMMIGLCQENGHREAVAVAMVDIKHPDVIIDGELLCPSGQILNLTARDATRVSQDDGRPILARGMSDDLAGVLAMIGTADAELQRFSPTRSERLARWITALGPLLFSLAVLAFMIEFHTPGFGVFGMSGIALMVLYLFGHYVAGLAGMEELALIMLGLILLLVEIFLIPGFGVTGIAGIALMIIGGGLAIIPHIPDAPPLSGVEPLTWDSFLPSVFRQFLYSLLIIAVGVFILRRYLPRTSLYRSFVLSNDMAASKGFVSVDLDAQQALLGQEGSAYTLLRPAGTAIIDGRRVDVISNGDFIPKGSRIRVVASEGTAVVVEKIDEGEVAAQGDGESGVS
jgi:membrane-bound serine protease (ClpP class)